ncbi:arginine repressor [Streptococcus pneumoniae]|uniref:arginine repressor n=1 Tax=Streptococcus TaxID=1301 RepID=UPI0005E92491|nr:MULTISPECIES: arginine repressor [Streptococcus]CIT52581.1 arginine repressor [Streptococcus pneumoniae]COD01183.1 arginine repressor [Streptococcus pneumoniae]COI02656.1 arginine repressor [Streptococcus pneumoniae]CON61724.1 arginine repressor [Streptococcus pneumoniae]
MNKSEHRHQLIRALVAKNKIHTQAELQSLLAENDIQVTQATLSRDIKNMNLSKVREEDNAYYVLNNGSISKWEKRLENYMEDALIMLRPIQHQVLLKTLPGLAQSFATIIDALDFQDIIATLCGDDVCLIICEDADTAQKCFEELKKFAPPFFFEE